MDLSPILRERHQQMMRTSRIKLVVMVVLLVVVVLVMIELARWGNKALERSATQGEDADEAKRSSQVDPKKTMGVEESHLDISPVPVGKEPPELAVVKKEVDEKFPSMADPKTLDKVEDQSTELEPGPLFYLVYQVFQEKAEKLKAEAEAAPPWDTLWEKAVGFRGRPLRVAGELVQMWEQPLGQNPMGLEKLYAYRLRAPKAPANAKGYLYDVYSIERLKGALRYDQVAACGRFLKAQVSLGERLRDPEFHVAVLIAQELEPPTYLDAAKLPGPIVDGNRAEARSLYWLLKRAREVSFDELKAKANRDLTHANLRLEPEQYRAKPVAISGQLRRLIRMVLPENRLDMTTVFYGQVADRDRGFHTFYCLDIPDGIRDDDPVILYGYFLKKWTYADGEGRQHDSPVLVAKRMLILDYGDAGSGHSLEIALAVVVGITAAALGVAITISRRRDREAEEARRQRQTERARAVLHHTHEKPPETPQEPPKPEAT
ncbi:MAG: hypothetical protein FJ291_07885 [Planctomycetes bacterium]|nr:hypothetical protein [Planctomycetota bacterium]